LGNLKGIALYNIHYRVDLAHYYTSPLILNYK